MMRAKQYTYTKTAIAEAVGWNVKRVSRAILDNLFNPMDFWSTYYFIEQSRALRGLTFQPERVDRKPDPWRCKIPPKLTYPKPRWASRVGVLIDLIGDSKDGDISAFEEEAVNLIRTRPS